MPMSLDLLLRAFTEIIAKRGLLDHNQIPKLIDFATRAGIDDHRSLTHWVSLTPKLTKELRKELLDVLRLPQHRQIGDFEVVGHLADGGMGDVWLAADHSGRLGVIKTLLPELRNDSEFIRRFQREAQITARFSSPYLVRCLEYGDVQGSPYLTLEYVDGGDLHNLICSRQSLSEDETLRIGQQLALGLVHAHSHNLVHRDIKPENILLAADGCSKLVDFGLARTTKDDRTMLTLAGNTLGTPDYMSPEQIHGDSDLDIRSDLYAVGCVLFFCLAGHPPYEGDSIDIMKAHISSSIPDIRRLNRSVSRGMRAIINRCMAKERRQRYQHPQELADACADLLARSSPASCDTTVHGLRRAEILPPTQFHEESLIDLADLEDCSSVLYTPQPKPDWLVLIHAESKRVLHCICRSRLLLGKLRGPPVDVCLRYYPKDAFDAENSRVSRQHCEILRDQQDFTVIDLGSTNGILIDGQRIPAHTPFSLSAEEVSLTIPRSLTINLRCIGEGGRQGVLIQRPLNRPTLAYALVQGIVRIGGPGSDLPLLPEDSDMGLLLRPRDTGWEWNHEVGDDAWQAVPINDRLFVGASQILVRAGSYDDFA